MIVLSTDVTGMPSRTLTSRLCSRTRVWSSIESLRRYLGVEISTALAEKPASPPKCRGRSMGHSGSRPGPQAGRHESGVPRDGRSGDNVDIGMQLIPSPRPEPSVDPTRRHALVEDFLTGEDAVTSGCPSCYEAIHSCERHVDHHASRTLIRQRRAPHPPFCTTRVGYRR